MASHPILEQTWSEYRGWALASRRLKARYDLARTLGLSLGIAGATMATLASIFQDHAEIFGGLAGLALVLGGVLGREFLAPAQEARWVAARLMAEGIQREVWRALMRVAPYDGSEWHLVLADKMKDLSAPEGVVPDQSDGKPLPPVATVDDYLKRRLIDQIDWYSRTGDEQGRLLRRYSRCIFAFGVGAALLSWGSTFVELPEVAAYYQPNWPRPVLIVPLMTAFTAAVVAALQASRADSVQRLYKQTATALRRLYSRYTAEELTQPDKVSMLVNQAEQTMEFENGAWRASYLNQQKQKIIEDAYKAALASGGSGRTGGGVGVGLAASGGSGRTGGGSAPSQTPD